MVINQSQTEKLSFLILLHPTKGYQNHPKNHIFEVDSKEKPCKDEILKMIQLHLITVQSLQTENLQNCLETSDLHDPIDESKSKWGLGCLRSYLWDTEEESNERVHRAKRDGCHWHRGLVRRKRLQSWIPRPSSATPSSHTFLEWRGRDLSQRERFIYSKGEDFPAVLEEEIYLVLFSFDFDEAMKKEICMNHAGLRWPWSGFIWCWTWMAKTLLDLIKSLILSSSL